MRYRSPRTVAGANLSDAAREASPPPLGVAVCRRDEEEPRRGAVPVGLSKISRLAPQEGQYRLVSPTGVPQDGQADIRSSEATIRRYVTWRREIPAFRSPRADGHVSAAVFRPEKGPDSINH